jgi:hypothetical protein
MGCPYRTPTLPPLGGLTYYIMLAPYCALMLALYASLH